LFAALLECLGYEEKWKEACANKKEKTTPNASPGASTPPSSENNCGNEQDCASQSTEHTNARPDGRKKEKERLRKGKNPLPSAENLFMDAMENLWAKKKEMEEMKELKKKSETMRELH